jgi:general secretion pathway protein G
MTKPECRRNTGRVRVCHSSFELPSSFVPALRDHSSFRVAGAFTLIELLTVMAIIIVLAGLIAATAGYVQKKGYRSRAEVEIAAISAALENYRADNGTYPRDSVTDNFSVSTTNASDYDAASVKLYEYLSGDATRDRIAETKAYFPFKPNQLSPADQTQPVTAVHDPFGNSYGYSTAKAANPIGSVGYNPTFDLWSIADGKPGNDQTKWIKNW